MTNKPFQSSLFTTQTPSLIEFTQAKPSQIPKFSYSELQKAIQIALSPPNATVTWHGRLQTMFEQQSSVSLKHLLEQMKFYPDVLVVDFNWTNFATVFNHESWGMIGNLHPRNCLKLRQQRLQKLLLHSLSLKQQMLLEQASTQEAGEIYRLSIRNSMLEKLVELAKDYRLVISETLDVHRLHQFYWKKAVIEDLGWLSLLKDFKGLLETQGTELILLEREYKSLTCPRCQCTSPRNRNGNEFYCVQCSFNGAPDFMAGMNMWADWLARGHPNMEETK